MCQIQRHLSPESNWPTYTFFLGFVYWFCKVMENNLVVEGSERLTKMFSDCGRKLENPRKVQGETLHTDSPKLHLARKCFLFNMFNSMCDSISVSHPTSSFLVSHQVFHGHLYRPSPWTVCTSLTWWSVSTSLMRLLKTDWVTAGSTRKVVEFTTWASTHPESRSEKLIFEGFFFFCCIF